MVQRQLLEAKYQQNQWAFGDCNDSNIDIADKFYNNFKHNVNPTEHNIWNISSVLLKIIVTNQYLTKNEIW